MKKIPALLFILFCTTLLSAQDNRRTVAVVPAQGYGIPQNIRDGVTEGLLEGVVNSGQFRAVARGADFQRALGEMDFQQGGAVADDQLIEFGRALRADFVSFAVISRFGEGLYRITFRMVDVASGEIPQGLAGSETVTTGALGVLQATDNIAQRLFGGRGGGVRPDQPSEGLSGFLLQAQAYSRERRFREGRAAALRALEVNPNEGKAHFLIAMMYAQSARDCGGHDPVSQRAVYWVVVDRLIRARSLSPNLPQVNEYIATFTQHFPSGDDLFFQGIQEGSTWRVGCWIQENTIVRRRP